MVRMCDCKRQSEEVVKKFGGRVERISGPVRIDGMEYSFHDIAVLPDGRVIDNSVSYESREAFWLSGVISVR